MGGTDKARLWVCRAVPVLAEGCLVWSVACADMLAVSQNAYAIGVRTIFGAERDFAQSATPALVTYASAIGATVSVRSTWLGAVFEVAGLSTPPGFADAG